MQIAVQAAASCRAFRGEDCMKLGCCTTIENYPALCELGYDFIELSAYDLVHMSETELEDAAQLLKKHGVPCLALNAYCRGDLPMVGPAVQPDEVRAYAGRACARAARLGAETLGIGSPAARRLPEGYPLETADAQMREFLRITAREADKYHLRVLYEPLNRHLCEYGLSTAHAVEMIRSVGEANVGLVLDFHHMALSGEEICELGDAVPLTQHLHINHVGADRRKHYMSQADVPFAVRVLRGAKQLGYDRALSVEAECSENGFVTDAGTTLQALRAALKQIEVPGIESKENEQ